MLNPIPRVQYVAVNVKLQHFTRLTESGDQTLDILAHISEYVHAAWESDKDSTYAFAAVPQVDQIHFFFKVFPLKQFDNLLVYKVGTPPKGLASHSQPLERRMDTIVACQAHFKSDDSLSPETLRERDESILNDLEVMPIPVFKQVMSETLLLLIGTQFQLDRDATIGVQGDVSWVDKKHRVAEAFDKAEKRGIPDGFFGEESPN